MATDSNDTRAAFRTKTAELAIAGLFFLVGAIVIFDSLRLGARWGDDGPQPGYFPFYLGIIICVLLVRPTGLFGRVVQSRV